MQAIKIHFIDSNLFVPQCGGYVYYTTLFTLYKSPEKKWHRSVKKDIYKCPFFKRAVGLCAKGSLKNAL